MKFLLIPFMAWVSRMAGGAWPRLPLCADQIIYAVPFAVVVFLLYLPTVGPLWEPYPWHVWVYSGLAFLTAFLGKLTGPGRGISLFEPMKEGSKPERVEFLVLWLMPHIPTICYKSVILTLCEAIVWAGISLALSPWLILCAFLRPAAYHIGWGVWLWAAKTGRVSMTQIGKKKIRKIRFLPLALGEHTAIGEFLTGAATGAVLALLLN